MPRLIALFSLILIGKLCSAQITSTFDTDADGWTASHTGGTAATFNHQSSGGNPDGFISAAPPTAGGSVNIGFAWYWNAPAQFFGNYDFSYGSNFKVDLQQSVAGTDNTQSDIIIYSGGNSIHYNFPTKPAVSPEWSSYSIALDETAGWRWNSVAGALALKPQIKIVLANITGIRIRCKYINSTGYTSGIDNVTIEKRTLPVSPVITSFSPISTFPDETVTINGSNFGIIPANNIVYFGLVRAEVLTATTSQLTVKVPKTATIAPVSVINTSTGLTAVSAFDFLPLTVTDPDFIGHLLPGSFSNNVIIPYGDFNDNGLAGGAMGDIDGDGLLDIVAFQDPGSFAIFLNQGQTGALSPTSFSSKIEIPSGELGQGNSNGTILKDFDNDGKLDIATYFRGASASLTGGFTVSRNISTPGNILFESAKQFYNVGIFCSGLDGADLDGDGLVDFLINSSGLYYAQNISTPGNIEFATLRFLNSAGGAVSTKDLNGDGKPEIMVVGSNSFNLLENLSTPGNIQFATPVNFPGSAVSGITMADLDSDNKPDILYYRINGFNNYDLVIKKNIHSSGALTTSSFDSDIIISKVNRAYSQRVADLNGDGKPDILIGLTSGSTGYGFGVFESRAEPGTLNTSSFFSIVEYEETSNGSFAIPLIGDLNGDLLPDVVGFASSDGGEHGLILYTNQTTSAPNISVNTVSPLTAPVGSTVTITGNKFSSDITKNTVWFGAVKAQVLTASKNEITVTVPPGASYERVSVTRDNRTSRYHLPFSTTFSSGVTFDGTSFAAPITFPVTGADYDVEAADLNGDGKPELIAESRVVTGIIRNYAWSFENVHTTGSISSSSFIISDTTNESALNLRLVDLDEDGRPDILSQQALFRNSTSTNEIEFDNNVNGAGGGNQNWADFDLDGKTDVVATNTGGASLLLYRNTSKPGPFRTGAFATFGTAIGLGKPAASGGTAVGDFDNDGFVEFASTNPTSDNMRVWRNNGGFPLSAAQFSVVGDLPTGDNPGRLYTGDFDQDGKLDLLLYHGTGTNNTLLIIFHNTSTVGNISFTRIDLTNPSATTVATIADLDGDGKPEIITTSESGNRFSIFKNIHTSGALSAASFAAPFNTTVTAPRGLTTGDLNLDGKPEIIITRAAGFLVVYENLVSTASTQNFITQWNIATAGSGATQLSFGTATSGVVNYTWQEISPGSASGSGSWNGSTLTITGLPTGATIRLQIEPTNFQRINVSSGLDEDRLTEVEQWGTTAWVSMQNAFRGCTNLQITATDVPDLSGVTDMSSMFESCSSLNSPNNIGTWNTANVTNMGFMFYAASSFNQDISAWNTASVTNMNTMFSEASAFNQDIGSWNTAAVTDMSDLFGYNTAFNQDISGWNTGAVTDMSFMFRGATAFDHDISAWNTAAVTDMRGMFRDATAFNQNLGSWNLGAVVDIRFMLDNMGMDCNNYSATLNGWSANPTTPTGRTLGATGRQYGTNAVASRTNLTTTKGWTITGDTPSGTICGVASTITITTQPGGTMNRCVGDNYILSTEATGTTNITYQWQKFNGSIFVNLTNNATFTNVNTNTLTVTNVTTAEAGDYRCLITGDLAADVFTNVATLVVNPLPAPPDVTGASTCGSGSVILTASGGAPGQYRWYTQTPLALIGGEVNETYNTPVLTATTTYLVSIADAFCESTQVPVTATVASVPAQPVIASSITPVGNAVTVCSSATLTLTAPAGFASYLWSNGETMQQISPASSGAYSVTVTNAEGCTSPASPSLNVTVVLEPCGGNQPPVIATTVTGLFIEGIVNIDLTPLLSDPDDNLDLASLRVITTQTSAGASASINASGQLILNYGGVLFTGEDRITIEVCDLFGICTQQQLTIQVEGDIIVRTGFSPNGDDRNDFFQIDYIDLFPDTQQNKVTIYNRWGDVVFEISNYDNESRIFTGLNKNGNELPSGTYFYKLEFKSGRPAKTGYLSLRK